MFLPTIKTLTILHHVRLSKLTGVDAVDEPAANVDGVFGGNDETNEFVTGATAMLLYALGHGPKPSEFSEHLDSDRFKQFVTRVLASHKLSVVDDKTSSEGESLTKSEIDNLTTAFGHAISRRN